MKTTRHHKNTTICLIYILRNKINDKVYIGQTWRPLKARFNSYRKSQPYLFNAINKHGKNNFYYKVLCVANTQIMADYWEGYFITKYDSVDNDKGYNLRGPGGSHGKFSQISKDKMSKQKLGKSLSESHKQNLSIAFSGENNPAAKITEDIVKEIYIRCINEPLITTIELSKIYNICTVSINSILNRTAWFEATKYLPNINRANRARISYDLTDQIVIDIKTKYKNEQISQTQLSKLYNVSITTIHEIVRNKTWKHIII